MDFHDPQLTSMSLKRPSIIAHTFSNVNILDINVFHGYRIYQDLQALPFPTVDELCLLHDGDSHPCQLTWPWPRTLTWQWQTVCRIWAPAASPEQDLGPSSFPRASSLAHTKVAFCSTAQCLHMPHYAACSGECPLALLWWRGVQEQAVILGPSSLHEIAEPFMAQIYWGGVGCGQYKQQSEQTCHLTSYFTYEKFQKNTVLNGGPHPAILRI